MISIINYGLGNINAIASAYESLGVKSRIIDNSIDLHDASHIILPGVGSFDDAMEKIDKNGFKEVLNELVLEKKVFILGICVGLQIMSNSSDEGTSKGFGWLDVETKKIDTKDNSYKIPHIGWNKIKQLRNCKILQGVDDMEFYFLHSFNILDESNKYTSSTSSYNLPIVASISHQNIFGTQFHPEKSHNQGLKVLHNFSQLK
tara:strand:+ start:428 stop:1036 length:609 start_codon:yes stop_codon:yes gene_type:complete